MMTCAIVAFAARCRPRVPAGGRLSLGTLPTPALFGLAVGAAGAWGWLLHAAGATGVTPLAFLAVGIAAVLASIGGFAFGPICSAILLPIGESPVQAVQIILVCSIANQVMSVWAMRRAIDWRGLWPYLAGGAFGVPVGIEVLLRADASSGYPHLLGALLVGYCGWVMFGRSVTLPALGRLADGVVGALGGVMGGLAGFPSAPVTVWCGLKGWDKARQRGIYQPFILPMQILALGLMTVLAPSQGAVPRLGAEALLFIPASVFGTACGLALFRRLTDRQFGRAVTLMLLAAGTAMMLR